MKRIRGKKGFTLVEVIVVLVIIAILAALLVPSLSGYIDKANNQALEVKIRGAVMAAQTLASEEYARSKKASMSLADIPSVDIVSLAETGGSVTSLTVTGGKVVSLVYTDGAKTYYYSNGVYSSTAP